MGIIEDKYSIYYINDKRYYVETMNKSLMLENTIPYMFEYKNIRIYDTAWNRITVKILEEIDEDYVIADMSNIGRKHFFSKDKSSTDLNLSSSDVKEVIKGTISASLLIGLVYAVVFGIFIFLLTLYFRSL